MNRQCLMFLKYLLRGLFFTLHVGSRTWWTQLIVENACGINSCIISMAYCKGRTQIRFVSKIRSNYQSIIHYHKFGFMYGGCDLFVGRFVSDVFLPFQIRFNCNCGTDCQLQLENIDFLGQMVTLVKKKRGQLYYLVPISFPFFEFESCSKANWGALLSGIIILTFL
jgi:hypothetical protein